MEVYLDNAATTKVADEVLSAMLPYLTVHYGNPSSMHSFGKVSSDAIEKARAIIAESIHALSSELIFTSGGTESNNIAIQGVMKKSKNKHIITTAIEHSSILACCKQLETEGHEVTYLPVDKEGFVDPEKIKSKIKSTTVLISVHHANNEIGTIQDILSIGKIAREHSIYFHVDAVQSFTKTPIDVASLPIDLMSISAHKIHGPKGVGGLFVRKGIKLYPLHIGGDQEFGIRPGTENVPGIVGFGRAIKLSKSTYNHQMEKLRNYFITALQKIPGVEMNGSLQYRLCNNINISFSQVGEQALLLLNGQGIYASTGSACGSGKPSHVLQAIGQRKKGSLRFSLSRFTTKEEIDYTIKHLNYILGNEKKGG